VARYGGDEFVLLLRATPDEVEQRMERLLSTLERRHRFTWAQGQLIPHNDWLEQINGLSKQVLERKSNLHGHTEH
jgi:GGDEF domain-containing protein